MELPKGIRKILTKLSDCGFEAYLVGGCVRDFLRSVPPSDYDITTNAPPSEVMRVFAGEKVIPTGLRHGTLTVCMDGETAEITTYRTDGTYTDGRHPDAVRFAAHLSDDLCRRDFTVNAMAMDGQGNVIDLYGGRADLAAHTVRAVGNPSTRFTEDALRILRAFRFASVLDFSVEPETLAAAVRLAPRLSLVSRERIFTELCKTLCGRNAPNVLADMTDGNVFSALFDRPQIGKAAFSYIGKLPARADVRLAALLLHDPNAETHIASLKPSAAFAGHTGRILACDLPCGASKPEVRRAICRFGKDAVTDRVCIDALERGDTRTRETLFALASETCFSVGDLAVGGADAAANGFAGKGIGEALTETLNAVFDEKLPNERAAELAFLRRLAEKH